jgi:hypothetical protein
MCLRDTLLSVLNARMERRFYGKALCSANICGSRFLLSFFLSFTSECSEKETIFFGELKGLKE